MADPGNEVAKSTSEPQATGSGRPNVAELEKFRAAGKNAAEKLVTSVRTAKDNAAKLASEDHDRIHAEHADAKPGKPARMTGPQLEALRVTGKAPAKIEGGPQVRVTDSRGAHAATGQELDILRKPHGEFTKGKDIQKVRIEHKLVEADKKAKPVDKRVSPLTPEERGAANQAVSRRVSIEKEYGVDNKTEPATNNAEKRVSPATPFEREAGRKAEQRSRAWEKTKRDFTARTEGPKPVVNTVESRAGGINGPDLERLRLQTAAAPAPITAAAPAPITAAAPAPITAAAPAPLTATPAPSTLKLGAGEWMLNVLKKFPGVKGYLDSRSVMAAAEVGGGSISAGTSALAAEGAAGRPFLKSEGTAMRTAGGVLKNAHGNKWVFGAGIVLGAGAYIYSKFSGGSDEKAEKVPAPETPTVQKKVVETQPKAAPIERESPSPQSETKEVRFYTNVTPVPGTMGLQSKIMNGNEKAAFEIYQSIYKAKISECFGNNVKFENLNGDQKTKFGKMFVDGLNGPATKALALYANQVKNNPKYSAQDALSNKQ